MAFDRSIPVPSVPLAGPSDDAAGPVSPGAATRPVFRHQPALPLRPAAEPDAAPDATRRPEAPQGGTIFRPPLPRYLTGASLTAEPGLPPQPRESAPDASASATATAQPAAPAGRVIAWPDRPRRAAPLVAVPAERLPAAPAPRLRPVPDNTAPRHGPFDPPRPARDRRPVGEILVERGALSPADLVKALALQAREEARFGDILLAQGMVTTEALYQALAAQYRTAVADLAAEPPDVRLVDRLGAEFCIQNGVVPWKRVGGATVVIASRPDDFADMTPFLTTRLGRVRLAVAPEEDIQAALIAARHRSLAIRAETRVAEHESVRSWRTRSLGVGFAIAGALGLLFVVSPIAGFAVLTFWAVLTLTLNSGLKVFAAIHHLRHRSKIETRHLAAAQPGFLRLPTVSVLVPLYNEREVASRLVARLTALDYPRELLDICLIVEEDDTQTQQTLRRTALPRWMRTITVPRGAVRTKPRALNFALDFARGSIIGVYDAEDAPEPGQIHKVVRRFAERGADVACLQGVLDFYNAKQNWLSRAFTIEYATWFRIVLPGLERMGFAVPLGGTTLFFRRAPLEELGGWDAHNVTEDADLGIRLARHGYRTELIDTVTKEEANCRPLPWIKQRSRWIKGYAMTYGVHMRNPARLLREVGLRKFIGVQILFLGTLSQFLLAPVLWSFWALPLGLPHPLVSVMPSAMFWLLSGVFIFSEALTIAVGVLSVSHEPEHRFLMKWVPTLHVYFPLASLAAMKGAFEILTRPFYWDKTQHGLLQQDVEIWTPSRLSASPVRRPRRWTLRARMRAEATAPLQPES